MKKAMMALLAVINSREGQGFVEYALLCSLIAIAAAAAFSLMIGQMPKIFSGITDALSGRVR